MNKLEGLQAANISESTEFSQPLENNRRILRYRDVEPIEETTKKTLDEHQHHMNKVKNNVERDRRLAAETIKGLFS